MQKAKTQSVLEKQQLCAPSPWLLSTLQLEGKSSLHTRALVRKEPHGHAATGVTGNSKPQQWEESSQAERPAWRPARSSWKLPARSASAWNGAGGPLKSQNRLPLLSHSQVPICFSFSTALSLNYHHTEIFRHRPKGRGSWTVRAMALSNQAKLEK